MSSSGGPTRRWRRRPLKRHFGVLLDELDGLPSSAFVAKAFTGAKLVKAFNHLVAATLTADPIVEGGHRVTFLSSVMRPCNGGSSSDSTRSGLLVAPIRSPAMPQPASIDFFDRNPDYTGSHHPERTRCTHRHVDYPATNKRSTIVDAALY